MKLKIIRLSGVMNDYGRGRQLHIYRDCRPEHNTEESLLPVLDAYGVKMEDLTADERTQVSEAPQRFRRASATSTTPSPRLRCKNREGNRPPRRLLTDRSQSKRNRHCNRALKGKGYPEPVGLMLWRSLIRSRP